MGNPNRDTGSGGGKKTSTTNTITGSNDNDTLSGLGDPYILEGGRGDDTYLIDDPGDEVVEKKNSGTDTVISLISTELSENVENLVLDGTADLNGTGNDENNHLTGNSGNNVLNGMAGDDTLFGGAGSDTLIGGSGDDTSVFSGTYDSYVYDWIDGLLHVTTTDGSTSVLDGVEYVEFADQTMNTSDIVATAAPEPEPEPTPEPAPVANDDSVSGSEDSSLTFDPLANDTGDGLTLVSVTDGTIGTAVQNSDGTVTYTSNPDANGDDQFTYTVSDAYGQTATATVTVDIAAVNDTPTAADDSFTTQEGVAFTSATSVLANDTDPDGDSLSISSYASTTALGGTVQMNTDGTFTYTPADGVAGSDSFDYTISDGNGGIRSATVTIDVAPATEDNIPYYVEALLYDYDYMRLNYPDDIGTAVTVTYTFLDTVPSYNATSTTLVETFQAFSAQQQQVTQQILDMIESFTNIDFVEVDTVEESTITFGLADFSGDSQGTAWYPMGNSVNDRYSDVWIDTDLAGDSIQVGSEAYVVLMHELAHAIGLDHATLPAEEENRQYSLMEAAAHPGMGNMSDGITGYQMYDIAALQHLYGTDTISTAGDDIYDFFQLDNKIVTIWDAGGNDTLDLSAATYGVTLILEEGSFGTVAPQGVENVGIAYNSVIENAIGGNYDDHITGNGADNILTGMSGNDTFHFNADWGQDVITDFVNGEDLIALGSTGAQYSDLNISSNGSDTVIEYNGDSITLTGVTQIDTHDFMFV